MNAKITAFFFFNAMILSIFAGEREDLLKTFADEIAKAEKSSQQAMTTIELTVEAGKSRLMAENQYFRALDYKLRHTENLQDRLNILKNFHSLSLEVQKIFDTPRENKGSLIGMQINYYIANLFQQQIDILMLDSEKEKLWARISDAPILINGEELQLKRGRTDFTAIMYDNKEDLELILFPENTFHFRDRDFAVIRTNIRFSVNTNFSTVYLFELKNGKLTVHTQCKFPFITKWELNGDSLIFYGEKEVQKIKL